MRLLTNDCKMYNCSNIKQSNITWVHFDVIWKFIFESIFFLLKSHTIIDIKSIKISKNDLFVIINKSFIILNFTCQLEHTCNASIKSTHFSFKQWNRSNLFFCHWQCQCIYIYRNQLLTKNKKNKNLHHINTTHFNQIDF